VRKEIPPTEVRTIPVQRTSFNYLIHTNGRIQASTDVTVLSRAVGLADEVLVHNGSYV
jgi:multidrug efflux pump subunit AcrA (membrane-fusion protein)